MDTTVNTSGRESANARWIVMARDSAEFSALARLPEAHNINEYERKGVWTDDYSNVLSVFKWRRRQ